MSVYLPSALQRQVRQRFANCCAYCRTAEALTVSTFEFEHIVPLSAGVATVTVGMLKMNRPQMTRVRRMWVKLGEHPPDIG
ncbi:hypothetical protein HC928_04860 [bacterium]|nr:hypothetical protein [bacterium]